MRVISALVAALRMIIVMYSNVLIQKYIFKTNIDIKGLIISTSVSVFVINLL